MSNTTIHSTITTIQFSIMAALKPTLDCYCTDKHRVISEALVNTIFSHGLHAHLVGRYTKPISKK